jgi:hypothetical protein
MSVLSVAGRPLAVFNVKDRKHRELYAQFVRTGTWSKSPVRFIASEPTESDVGTIARQVIEFYVEKEFAKRG